MKTALVTGGNRGIGLAIVRGLAAQGVHVYLAARNAERATAAIAALKTEGVSEVEYLALDVTDEAGVDRAAKGLAGKAGHLDALVNNAGVFLDEYGEANALSVESDIIRKSFEINTIGPLLVTRAFLPLLEKASGGAQVVNISSGMGQLSDMMGGSLGYRLSKTALNALTRVLAYELESRKIRVNSICPGWVHTDMGGPNAPRTPEQGAETAVWLANGGAGTATGGFYRDKAMIAW